MEQLHDPNPPPHSFGQHIINIHFQNVNKANMKEDDAAVGTPGWGLMKHGENTCFQFRPRFWGSDGVWREAAGDRPAAVGDHKQQDNQKTHDHVWLKGNSPLSASPTISKIF